MIGIRSISSFIPEKKIDNIKQALDFGEDESFISKKIGALTLPVISGSQETSDMAVAAVNKLIDEHGLVLSDVDTVVVITQNGDGSGLPHTSAIVQSKLGLSGQVAAFDVSLGCSGYVYGLSIIKGFMENAGLKNGLLITADPYSKVIDRNDRITSMLFGDAATATWLTDDSSWKFGKPLVDTDGSGASNIEVVGGVLSMNGRQVFNFASKSVPSQIREFLVSRNLKTSDIDRFCLHQGSLAIIDAIARRFPEVKERFVSDIRETGNTVSSSIPLLLETLIKDEALHKILISGFGVGLSWATNIIYREA
ncbi:ketoacyl-ACP synthase III [Porticoccaceae bacterium]|nr:ketoacyl-ACP synthase III [Porticoccaceae bacterium]